MLILGIGPGLKDSLRTGDKSSVLALALRVKVLVNIPEYNVMHYKLRVS